ncbi:MAG TPA: hypothetical protein VEG84_07170 [Thermoanaerobaculia bacterium]|nr:hypothetical protein [Thermoanaerobaculia bacterium]
MQSAGFRRLDFQIDLEIFGKSSGTVVPRYSADRAAAEQVVRKVRHLYPEWKFSLTEDQWGYTATWQCAGRPAASSLVTLGQHRSPTLTVAMTRACLLAVQNMRRYEERRHARLGAAPPAPAERTLEQKRSG